MDLTNGGSCQGFGVKVCQPFPPICTQLFFQHPLLERGGDRGGGEDKEGWKVRVQVVVERGKKERKEEDERENMCK